MTEENKTPDHNSEKENLNRPAQYSHVHRADKSASEEASSADSIGESSEIEGSSTREEEQQEHPTEMKFDSRLDLSALSKAMQKIRVELRKVIVGQDEMVDLLMVTILANGHSLIEGVPGVAKTVTAKLLAKTLDIGFSRIQFTPDLMPSDILGTSVFNMKSDEFEFKAGPIFNNMILIDEINRAPAKTQAALFEAMAERQITIDGTTYEMQKPFLVFATQNPIEQEGTYRLPEAQLDRFLFKINVSYPNLEQEINILMDNHQRRMVQPESLIESVLTAEQITHYQGVVREIVVEDNLLKYIAQIILETRENPNLYLGASPRASIAVLNASKAFAALSGRDFVTPDDIKYICKAVLRHRIILAPEREMEGFTTDQVIARILEMIEVPR